MELKKQLESWGHENGQVKAHLLLTLENIRELLEASCMPENREETEEILQNYREVNIEVKNLKAEFTSLNKRKDKASKNHTAINKKLKEVMKTHSGYYKPVCREIEKLLSKTFGIERLAYHGGDLCGNACRLLMSSAKDVLSSIETDVLNRYLDKKCTLTQLRKQVNNRIKATAHVLTLFDGVLTIARKDHHLLGQA